MRSGTVDGLNANNTGVINRCVTVELLTGETILIPIEVCKIKTIGIAQAIFAEKMKKKCFHELPTMFKRFK